MAGSWGSSVFGASLTFSGRWTAQIVGPSLLIHCEGGSREQRLVYTKVTVTPGLIWASVTVASGARSLRLDGIPNADAADFANAVNGAHAEAIRAQLGTLEHELALVVKWHRTAHALLTHQSVGLRRWITKEVAEAIETRPSTTSTGIDIAALVAVPEIDQHIRARPELFDAITLWRSPSERVSQLNDEHLRHALREYKEFFDVIEKEPLTDEQRHAVICFDNRVQVVASAGSGKTSTMVAKAGYAVRHKLVAPKDVLLLAFNKDAADELQQRIAARLSPLGLPADKITAKTFHAFGLEVIGHATGKKPTLAPWLGHAGGDIEVLSEIVDGLKKDAAFLAKWDLFRFVFGRDIPSFGSEEDLPEDWDKNSGRTGFRTLQGEVVKSQAERLIADWLFYQGVSYEYERPFVFDTADATHRQYRPDFHYPGARLYHEHFALDENGKAPETFANYMDGVRWKRAIHASSKTAFIETTMAQLWSGELFAFLAQELKARGIEMRPDPEREVPGHKVVEQSAIVKLLRSVLTHVKSNRLTIADLRAAADAQTRHLRYRRHLFIDLFEKVQAGWEDRLRKDGVVDFEDMLGRAADLLEQGQWQTPYRLIMVDEFQDVSVARARLIKAMLAKPGRYLFVVGDDWQGINRFAGADVSVMTRFAERFGDGLTLLLQQTFRCPQHLCDISSRFVQRNPAQIKKVVRSDRPMHGAAIRIIQVAAEEQLKGAIAKQVAEMPPNSNVYILGRYRQDRQHVPTAYPAHISLEFMTVHGSKGLEADYVILPRMVQGTYGFPSQVEDDPILSLAMPQAEEFPHGEERRLFYVALTRARRQVLIFTVEHKISQFVLELLETEKLQIEDASGTAVSVRRCQRPECNGTMVPRNGKFGPFLGCSEFPRCKHTEKVPQRSR